MENFIFCVEKIIDTKCKAIELIWNFGANIKLLIECRTSEQILSF